MSNTAVDLCVRMLEHSLWAERTQDRRPSEVKEMLRFFFTDEEIDAAIAVITGREPSPSIAEYTEKQAADRIGCSYMTLKRARKRGNIAHLPVGERGVRYTEEQIQAYLNRDRKCKREDNEPCQKGAKAEASESPRSESSGSHTTRRRPTSGASRGTTRRNVRLAGVAQAQRILQKQSDR